MAKQDTPQVASPLIEVDPDAWLVDEPAAVNAAPEDAPAAATNPRATLLLAHGASAAMDSTGMTRIAASITAQGVRVVRFEFPYMAGRRSGGKRKPPPRAEKLMPVYSAIVAAAHHRFPDAPLLIGGKSMGGRVATMIADEHYAAGTIAGAVAIGYPFHPPTAPEKLRTAHLEALACPLLICQGTRDSFGTEAEVSAYELSQSVKLQWFADGDHDLKPRVRSGETWGGHIARIGAEVSNWLLELDV